MGDWFRLAMRRDVAVRALKVAAVVGSILVAINQGDLILSGRLGVDSLWKIPLTYFVPYCVSTYSNCSAIRAGDA
jgi:hypothetical protein